MQGSGRKWQPDWVRMLVMTRQKTAAGIVLGLSILFFIFFETCKHTPTLGTTNPFAEDPYDAVGSFAIFLAFVGALLMVLRTFRTYPINEISAGQRVLAFRAGAVAVLSVVVTLTADAIGLGRAVITTGSFPAAKSLAEILVGMSLVTLLTGWIFIRASRGVEKSTGTATLVERRNPLRVCGTDPGVLPATMAGDECGRRDNIRPGWNERAFHHNMGTRHRDHPSY